MTLATSKRISIFGHLLALLGLARAMTEKDVRAAERRCAEERANRLRLVRARE